MKRLIFFLLAVVMIFTMAGCASTASGLVAESDKPRDTSPQVDTETWEDFIEGNSTFALDLYQALRDSDTNLFFSPYSISLALAMAQAGARGQTEADIQAALHFLSPEALHTAFNRLSLELAERGQGALGKDGEGFRLHIVNATWGQKDYKFMESYLDTLAVNYDAGLRLVDFIKDAEKARIAINDWVAEQTEERIKDLIPPGGVNELTRLVLTNAIYFNAAWQIPFNENQTVSQPFYLLDGSSVAASMMNIKNHFRYAEGDNYQAVELLYDGGELSMVIILPGEGAFQEFESSFDYTTLENIMGNMFTSQVTLGMPKFEFESSLGLKQALTSLGMGNAFTDDANFSGINGGKDLRIQDVLHKAFVSVDEAGTEAAAATAVIVGTTSMPAQSAVMTINRPFMFLIRDNATGSIIFLGRVMNPTT